MDTLSPVWQKKAVLQYRFEERQYIKLSVHDYDTDSRNLEDHDFLGCIETTLGDIMGNQSKGFTRPLEGGRGTISVTGEELLVSREYITLSFSARKLDKMDWFGKSDPYLEVHKTTENNQNVLVHRTEVIKKTLNPDWRAFKISASALCNGDQDRTLRCEIYDWNSNGTPDFIGSFETNLSRLKTGKGPENTYLVINKEKRKKKGPKYSDSGTIMLNSVVVENPPSFLDFISSGTQVNFTVAIDFTASNGQPHLPTSLHYRDEFGLSGRPNHYETAIRAVGGIIQDYDSDKQFPGLGFGARIPPDMKVSHEFFLSLDPQQPYCSGIEGVISAYHKALSSVGLYGPTNFAPVIRHVTKFAAAYQDDPTNYFVLLILTDGIITDFQDTKSAIIAASSLPLSIIIIGVGSEDFSAMEELDSDDALLEDGRNTAARDIVQFVELQKFMSGNGSDQAGEHLAREVLAEIPDQLLSFMKSKGFKPPEAGLSNKGMGAVSSTFVSAPSAPSF